MHELGSDWVTISPIWLTFSENLSSCYYLCHQGEAEYFTEFLSHLRGGQSDIFNAQLMEFKNCTWRDVVSPKGLFCDSDIARR